VTDIILNQGAKAKPQCPHPHEPPAFDGEAAASLSVQEIRRRWPRSEAPCPMCGVCVIGYASWEHYIAGDW
jgi:hypothetical protein